MNKYLPRVVKRFLVKVWMGIGMITSYLAWMSLNNDSGLEIGWLCVHDINLGSVKYYLVSLEEVNHWHYFLDLLK